MSNEISTMMKIDNPVKKKTAGIAVYMKVYGYKSER